MVLIFKLGIVGLEKLALLRNIKAAVQIFMRFVSIDC